MLVGRDDIHIVNDGGVGVLPSPVSAVISTRIKPGQEAAYRAWEQRIAAAQSKAPGFQGYRFEPPVPGVQDDWLAILRFDTEANLQAWLDSTERKTLLREAEAFTEEFHARIARTGFDQWFPVPAPGASPPAAWKQNMLVLLLLYPVVFLFGLVRAEPAAERPRRPAVRGRAVHRQHGERRAARLSGAVDQHALRLVAGACGRTADGSRSAERRWWSRSTP
jgi:antibiotic biosynthesis monooxygenase (ABM) superfamily enzyme